MSGFCRSLCGTPADLMSGRDAVEAYQKKLTEMRLDNREELDSLHARLKVTTKANRTLMLTNIGLIRMPEGMEEHITGFEPVAVNIEYSPAYCMITLGETGRLLASQNYDDTKLLEEIAVILRENGVETEFRDCGTIRVDTVEPYLFEKNGEGDLL